MFLHLGSVDLAYKYYGSPLKVTVTVRRMTIFRVSSSLAIKSSAHWRRCVLFCAFSGSAAVTEMRSRPEPRRTETQVLASDPPRFVLPLFFAVEEWRQPLLPARLLPRLLSPNMARSQGGNCIGVIPVRAGKHALRSYLCDTKELRFAQSPSTEVLDYHV